MLIDAVTWRSSLMLDILQYYFHRVLLELLKLVHSIQLFVQLALEILGSRFEVIHEFLVSLQCDVQLVDSLYQSDGSIFCVKAFLHQIRELCSLRRRVRSDDVPLCNQCEQFVEMVIELLLNIGEIDWLLCLQSVRYGSCELITISDIESVTSKLVVQVPCLLSLLVIEAYRLTAEYGRSYGSMQAGTHIDFAV